jgi:hypothetical protein
MLRERLLDFAHSLVYGLVARSLASMFRKLTVNGNARMDGLRDPAGNYMCIAIDRPYLEQLSTHCASLFSGPATATTATTYAQSNNG